MVLVPVSTGPEVLASAGRFSEGHTKFSTCLRSPDLAKMDPNAADMALAVWGGYVQDPRRHARQ